MSWAKVKKINGNFTKVSLDMLQYLEHYKMYGEDSYVFQQKELLHGLYECTYISMNDKQLSGEALEYLLNNNKHIGEAFSDVYGIDSKDVVKKLRMMTAVANSSTAMTAIAASSTAMTAIAASSTAMTAIAASSTAMTAILASSTAMTAIAASSTAMTAIAASSTAMTALSTSPLRKRVNYGQKAVGLILPMALGGYVYFDNRDDNSKYGRIEYTDGTLQPFASGNWITTHTGWGDVLRAKTKAAKLVRVFNGSNDGNWIDIILISGNITVA